MKAVYTVYITYWKKYDYFMIHFIRFWFRDIHSLLAFFSQLAVFVVHDSTISTISSKFNVFVCSSFWWTSDFVIVFVKSPKILSVVALWCNLHIIYTIHHLSLIISDENNLCWVFLEHFILRFSNLWEQYNLFALKCSNTVHIVGNKTRHTFLIWWHSAWMLVLVKFEASSKVAASPQLIEVIFPHIE